MNTKRAIMENDEQAGENKVLIIYRGSIVREYDIDSNNEECEAAIDTLAEQMREEERKEK